MISDRIKLGISTQKEFNHKIRELQYLFDDKSAYYIGNIDGDKNSFIFKYDDKQVFKCRVDDILLKYIKIRFVDRYRKKEFKKKYLF